MERPWLATEAGVAVPRRQRLNAPYQAYVPDPLLGQPFIFTGETTADAAEAEAALVRLDTRASALTSTESLARLLLRAESVASSRIEGLAVSPQRLLRAAAARDANLPVHDATAQAILANVDAVSYALEESGAITRERLLGVHERLLRGTKLADHAGRFRNVQNWIGGNDYTPFGAAFVPPPPEFVADLIADLCAFSNDDRLPAVAQAAIAHAQFETIHPFVDGNGRTGRALISMILRARGLAQRAIPPISLVLATQSKAYVAGLTETRYIGASTSLAAVDALDRWVAFFSAATSRSVSDARAFEERVEAIVADWRERTRDLRSDAAARKLIEILPQHPLVSVRAVEALLDRSFLQANRAVEALVDRQILFPRTLAKRSRVFEAREIVDAFTRLERQLASPAGDTRVSKPSRTVPARPARA